MLRELQGPERAYRLGYTEATLNLPEPMAETCSSHEHNELYFTEQLGIDFIESRFHIMKEDFLKVSPKDTQELRVIRMIEIFSSIIAF